MTESENPAVRKSNTSFLILFLRSHPKHRWLTLAVLIVFALLVSAVLAYFLWHRWLPPLWKWGFEPLSWRAILALFGAFYLAIGPLMPIYWVGKQIRGAANELDTGLSAKPKARKSAHRPRGGKIRLAFLIGGLIPIIIALLSLAVYGSIEKDWPTLRWIFLLIAIFFPAILYYLFNVSRRYSILTDLFSNMHRLGLLTEIEDSEKERARQQRVLTYLRKFEATYGPLGQKELERAKSDAKLTRVPPQIGDGVVPDTLSDVLTETRLPVIIATVLIAMGWTLALPPFEAKTDLVTKSPTVAVQGIEKNPAADLKKPKKLEETSGDTSTNDGHSDASPSNPKNTSSRGVVPEPAKGGIDWEGQFAPNLGLNSFAFLGAYFFSVQMLFFRYIRRDLNSSAYTGVALRIILAMIGTWVIFLGSDLFGIETIKENKEAQMVLAFCIGLLPKIVLQAIAEVSKKMAGWLHIMDSLRDRFPISWLDGLTVWQASRLEEEDLENIHGMASADIMELMIRTRFTPDRIVEWVDQAILFSQLADSKKKKHNLVEKLKSNGIRTATGLILNQIQEASALDKAFTDSEKIQLSLAGRVIRTKPNLRPILRWRGISEAPFKALPNGCGAETNGWLITTV